MTPLRATFIGLAFPLWLMGKALVWFIDGIVDGIDWWRKK